MVVIFFLRHLPICGRFPLWRKIKPHKMHHLYATPHYETAWRPLMRSKGEEEFHESVAGRLWRKRTALWEWHIRKEQTSRPLLSWPPPAPSPARLPPLPQQLEVGNLWKPHGELSPLICFHLWGPTVSMKVTVTFAIFHAPAHPFLPRAAAMVQWPSSSADNYGRNKTKRVIGAERRSDCLFIICSQLVIQSQGKIAQ